MRGRRLSVDWDGCGQNTGYDEDTFSFSHGY